MNELRSVGASVSVGLELSDFTTLRVGGPAAVLAQCPTVDCLVEVLRMLDAAEVPVLVLGGGSNVLISDAGFDGVVVRVGADHIRTTATGIVAEAGAVWDDVVAASIAAGLGGLECLSGIPGSAGATPVQNVGAYGVEISSALERVRLLDRTTRVDSWVSPDQLGLGYRTSILKHSAAATVLEVEFRLARDGLSAPIRYAELAARLEVTVGERLESQSVRDAVLDLRRGKAMVLDPADHDTWSVGSFFTNPIVAHADLPVVLKAIQTHVPGAAVPQYPATEGVKLSAGWLIERAGFHRGYPGPHAAAALSSKHTLALTNRGSASSADILALARDIRDGVRDTFGVELHIEPVTVGDEL